MHAFAVDMNDKANNKAKLNPVALLLSSHAETQDCTFLSSSTVLLACCWFDATGCVYKRETAGTLLRKTMA